MFFAGYTFKSRRNGEKTVKHDAFCRKRIRMFFKNVSVNHEEMEKKRKKVNLSRRNGEKIDSSRKNGEKSMILPTFYCTSVEIVRIVILARRI